MFDYIKNYPWRYYLKNAFRNSNPGSLVFRLRGNERADGVLFADETITFLPDLQEHSAALPLNPTGADGDVSIFGTGKQFHFLCDFPETEVRLLSVESLDIHTPQELFETPIQTLLPAMEHGHEYAWEFLAPDFSVITETLPASVLLVGIPSKLCDRLEQWSLTMGASAVGIEPWMLSTLRWCANRTRSFLLLPGGEQSLLGIFRDGNLLLLERLPAFKRLPEAPDKLANRIMELGSGLGLNEIVLEIYQGEIPLLKVKEFAATLRLPVNILGASEVEKSKIEAQGFPASTDACVMAESIHRDEELFISAEHRDATVYRTHPFYWGTFYVLFAVVVIQLAVFGVIVFQQNAFGRLTTISEEAAAGAAKIEADEAKLAPLIHRIRSVAPWNNFLREKEPVSRLLGRIETSVPPEVCLARITITNNTSKPTAPDRLTVKIRGWAKDGANLETAFLGKLRTALPTFKILEKAGEEGGPENSLTSFNVEITQP